MGSALIRPHRNVAHPKPHGDFGEREEKVTSGCFLMQYAQFGYSKH